MCESFREIGTFQSLTSSTFQVATTYNRGGVYNREGDKVSAGSERPGQISERPPCFRSGPIFGHHTHLRKSIMMANSSLPALSRAMTEMIFEMKMAVMMSLRIVIIMMIVVTTVRKWRRSLGFFIY